MTRLPMLKTMRLAACAATVSLPLILSCTTDAYDKGEGEYSNMLGDLVDLQVNDKQQVVAAVTDEDDRLTIANPFTVSWIQKADTTYRAYLYYNKENDGTAEVVSAGQVLVLRPRRESKPKADATGLESIWLSTNKKYLNMSLLLKVGQDGSDDVHHVLGATIDTLMANPDGTRTLHLHLYHDQGGVPEFYTQRTYASIPTTTVAADSIHLRINTYEGWRERTVCVN